MWNEIKSIKCVYIYNIRQPIKKLFNLVVSEEIVQLKKQNRQLKKNMCKKLIPC